VIGLEGEMLMLRRALFALAALTVAAPALAQSAANLTGRWEGGYVGANVQDANTLTVNLVQNGATLSGGMVEVNTIGDTAKNLFLTSTIQGTVSNGNVVFVKQYDGSGGVSHAVRYSGKVTPNGRHIKGTYSADGATGQFEFAR
jgi:hypothetical protein